MADDAGADRVASFDRCVVIGCGLIGGSLALAARQAGIVRHVVAIDRDPASAHRAVELGLADDCSIDVDDAIAAAQLVVVATPVAQIEPVLTAIAPRLADDAIVTDVASVKRIIIEAAERTLGSAFARFVPSHPIAGREVHGPDAARADLFAGRRVLLTPHASLDPNALRRVVALWRACGASVETIAADEHDRVLSAVSHLPHLLAYVLVAQVVDAHDASTKLGFAGGGFRDFTRIAASSPEMWRDIALANRDALLDDLDDYRARLDGLRSALAADDGAALEALFVKASIARAGWSES